MTLTAPAPVSTDCAVRVPETLWADLQLFAVARGYSVFAHPHADGQLPRYTFTVNENAVPGQPRNRTAHGLSDRELQVLQGMAAGKTNGDIGRELFLSEDTVKTHARRLFRKLGVPDRASAVATGFRTGVLA